MASLSLSFLNLPQTLGVDILWQTAPRLLEMARGKIPFDVFLYVPNLIGYTRIVCMLIAFAASLRSWKVFLVCYALAFAGDTVDGLAARKFDQSSKFGGVLDMITDRVETAGLLAILGALYPKWIFAFLSLMALDLFSHWYHVYVTCSVGHHKDSATLEGRHWLLRAFYGIYPFFAYLCVGTEVFYIALYVLAFVNSPALSKFCWFGCLPACVMKQGVNVAQMFSAMYYLALEDVAREA